MGYEEMTQTALRGVVRVALERAAKDGLPGEHHFYITFDTSHPGVELADYLRERYPEDMTIVLQHKYWGLAIHEESFEVTLSFNKRGERIVVPFAALKAFFDPSVQFGLQFRPAGGGAAARRPASELAGADAAPEEAADDAGKKPDKPGEVVSLDSFRKK